MSPLELVVALVIGAAVVLGILSLRNKRASGGEVDRSSDDKPDKIE